MKKIIVLSLLTVLSLAVFSQVEEQSAKKTKVKKKEMVVAEDTTPKVPEITFTYLVYDYGTIYKNGDGVSYFEFKNTGRADLQLTNVSSSCGCTVPQWPKEPVAPGESAKIKVSYNTNRAGGINKNVYVDSNAGERITLSIKGNVIEAPQEIVPESKESPMMKKE